MADVSEGEFPLTGTPIGNRVEFLYQATLNTREKIVTKTAEATFALIIGSKLVHESALSSPLPADLGGQGFIDGAIVLKVGEVTLLDERFWDRLDESMLRLLQGLDQSIGGEEIELELPDTRLQIQIEPTGEGMGTCTIEYRETSIPLQETREAVKGCASRLLQATEAISLSTPHLKELKHLLEGQ